MDLLKATIGRELRPNEKIFWTGQPLPGIRFHALDVVATICGCLFILAWFAALIGALIHDPEFRRAPYIFVIPSLLLFYFTFGRYFVDAKSRQKTFYALTNERVIIVTTMLTRDVKSISLPKLGDLSLIEREDKSGTISLGRSEVSFEGWPTGWPHTKAYSAPTFEHIANAREVYDMIRDAQKA